MRSGHVTTSRDTRRSRGHVTMPPHVRLVTWPHGHVCLWSADHMVWAACVYPSPVRVPAAHAPPPSAHAHTAWCAGGARTSESTMRQTPPAQKQELLDRLSRFGVRRCVLWAGPLAMPARCGAECAHHDVPCCEWGHGARTPCAHHHGARMGTCAHRDVPCCMLRVALHGRTYGHPDLRAVGKPSRYSTATQRLLCGSDSGPPSAAHPGRGRGVGGGGL
jgi:hypothetical protein